MQHEPVSQLIRVNGASPPDVVLGDIDLGAWDCWAQDDDLSDGAFPTLRHLAPVSFWTEAVQPGFESGRGHWGANQIRRHHLRQPSSGDLRLATATPRMQMPPR